MIEGTSGCFNGAIHARTPKSLKRDFYASSMITLEYHHGRVVAMKHPFELWENMWRHK